MDAVWSEAADNAFTKQGVFNAGQICLFLGLGSLRAEAPHEWDERLDLEVTKTQTSSVNQLFQARVSNAA